MGVNMNDYTDMDAWHAENTAFLTKIGQVEAKPKPTTKKDEDK
jgi:hypothetical protein